MQKLKDSNFIKRSKLSTATLGAGGLVFVQEHVLLVQPNYGPARGGWILPGGFVNEGEHPHLAAEREVMEETGLAAKAQKLVSVRHRIEAKDEVSANVYWVFLMKLETHDSTLPEVRVQTEELLGAKFWLVAEAIHHADVRPMTRLFINLGLDQTRGIQFTPTPQGHLLNDTVFG